MCYIRVLASLNVSSSGVFCYDKKICSALTRVKILAKLAILPKKAEMSSIYLLLVIYI
jgi:hypothetical protein